MRHWVKQWREEGSVTNSKPPGHRRRRSVRTPETIAGVLESAQCSPRTSRSHSVALETYGVYYALWLEPPHVQDSDPTTAQCKWQGSSFEILSSTREVINWQFKTASVSDWWDTFPLQWTVNKHNSRYWSDHNPHELHQRPLHGTKVTVWCGVSAVGIIGPYFCDRYSRTPKGHTGNTSYIALTNVTKAWTRVFSKMVLRLTQREFPWLYFVGCFRNDWFLLMVMCPGLLTHRTSQLLTFFFGDT